MQQWRVGKAKHQRRQRRLQGPPGSNCHCCVWAWVDSTWKGQRGLAAASQQWCTSQHGAKPSGVWKRKSKSNKEIKKLNLKRQQLWTSSECGQDTRQRGGRGNPKEDVGSSEKWGGSQQSRAEGANAAPHPYI